METHVHKKKETFNRLKEQTALLGKQQDGFRRQKKSTVDFKDYIYGIFSNFSNWFLFTPSKKEPQPCKKGKNMAERAVRKTRKDNDGDILALCDDGASWSPRSKKDAINDIESGLHTYFVPWKTGRTDIHVVNDTVKGKYLRTDRDETSKNNLDDLPDC